MADVTFRGVSKRYGPVVALDALDLDIASGEFVSLLGPSGSGKSTTLNLLAGLQDADTGRIRIGERDVTHVSPDKRDIALVFQSYALYPHLTVFENIAFPLEARRPRPRAKEIEAKVLATAGQLGIGELLARYPKEISGGQQQRVALGRAMVRDPKVFLLDEPLSNLDARLRIRMRRELKELHAALKSTIVYVTHDQLEAMSLSDRIAIFNHGRLQQVGTPAEIYDRPANVFVANFVGDRESNFLDGNLREADGGLRVEGEGFRLTLAHPPRLNGAGRAVTVGLRPEAIAVAEADAPAVNVVDAVVAETELVGPDRYLFARLAGGTELCCRCEPAFRPRPDEPVRLSIDVARLHLFDPETGRAILHGDCGAADRPPSNIRE